MGLLTDTYKSSKLLFGFFIFFIAGQLFFTYKGVETVPFFNYGMYSEPMKTKTKGYWIIANGDTLNDSFSHLSASMIDQNISYALETNGSVKDSLLMNWLTAYVSEVVQKPVNHLKIEKQ